MKSGGFDSELLFRARAKCLEVNERTYRWSESGSEASVMCDSSEDETVEHVVLVCGRYERLRERMMGVVSLEVKAWVGDVDKWTNGEWVRVLLGLSDRVSDIIVEVVKEFLDRVWRVRFGGYG